MTDPAGPPPRDEPPFFVGYLGLPRGLAGFVAGVCVALFLGAGGLALALGGSADDPGDGRFAWGLGEQRLTGVLEAGPYPVLHVDEALLDSGETAVRRRSLMLSGIGKRGVQGRAAPLDGRRVAVSGIVLRRGDLDMLQVGGSIGLRAEEERASAGTAAAGPEIEPLGRWRLTGEICDGKCYAGAMRPGRGLAHRACADLCLAGGVPPVFVAATPVEGETFFLIAGPDGGPMPERLRGLIAVRVEVEGEIERRGDLPVLRIDPATARVL